MPPGPASCGKTRQGKKEGKRKEDASDDRDSDAQRGMRKHSYTCHVWAAAWVGNIAAWWWAYLHGHQQRFAPDEYDKITFASLLWMTVAMVQHVLHIAPVHRAAVLCMALHPIALYCLVLP